MKQAEAAYIETISAKCEGAQENVLVAQLRGALSNREVNSNSDPNSAAGRNVKISNSKFIAAD